MSSASPCDFAKTDTSAGMSGSPVWFRSNNGLYYLVAVHSSFLDYQSDKLKVVNVGALMTREVIRQLRLWRVGGLEILII